MFVHGSCSFAFTKFPAVKETGCLGPCSSGPNVLATPRPASDPLGGQGREARSVGRTQQPAGVCFTSIKSEEDMALLSAWGFQSNASSNLSALRLLIRSTGADQVPWPILLYVGFNVIRLPINIIFHVDLLQLISQAVKPSA
ncbi:SLC25A17 [Symbiodinium pilosum]|uniref:SLC25A17 protein n=1 Tax=Symbiodinium pilosum TaxID=2952 RepID=A0A812IY92_SYMPI|nr:SLC25A17 [Symbiodinium pilosum]